jgi:hypothetical protein
VGGDVVVIVSNAWLHMFMFILLFIVFEFVVDVLLGVVDIIWDKFVLV